MDTIINAVVPLFSMITLGLIAGKARFFDRNGIATLVTFVFHLAMPALLFRMMATSALFTSGDPLLLGAYLVAQLPVFALGFLSALWLFRRNLAASAIQGFGSAFSNSVVLGLPLVLSLYGERASVPALLIITLDVVSYCLVILLLEAGSVPDDGKVEGRGRVVVESLMSVIKNPLIIATAAGVAVCAAGVALSPVVDRSLAFVGQAGPPAALFALGATLSQARLGGNLAAAIAMSASKLVIHPVLAWLVIAQLVELPPAASHVILIFAACPVGANTYVFAARYRAGVETASSAIMISTALAMVSVSGLLLFLPPLPPG